MLIYAHHCGSLHGGGGGGGDRRRRKRKLAFVQKALESVIFLDLDLDLDSYIAGTVLGPFLQRNW